MWVFNALLFYYSEHIVAGREDIDITTSLYWSIITMATIGYGDITPIRGLGWLVAGFAAIMGILAYTLTVSVIADAFLSASIRRAMGMAPLKKKEIIIIGDDESCRELVDELVINGLGDETGWLIPSQPRSEPPIDYLIGDPSIIDDLKKAGIDKARHVLLCLEDDSKTLHTALMVKRLNKEAKISAIVTSSQTEELLQEIGIKHTLSKKIMGRALASSVFEPAILLFLTDVISARGNGDLVEIVVNDKLMDKTIDEVEEILNKDKHYKYKVLAVYRDNRLELIPQSQYIVKKGDKVIALKARASQGY